MTRILSYNIQTGGTQRTDKLTRLIEATHPDIVGLVEATNPQVAEELAASLGMRLRLSGQAEHERDWQVGVLSRLPIVSMQVHRRPDLLTKSDLLEVCVEEADGSQLTVFVAHLTAAFQKGAESERIRRSEIQEILRIMAAKQGTPHLLMGDFNSVAPGENLKSSALLRYFTNPDQYYLKSYKEFFERSDLGFVNRSYASILKAIARNTVLSTLVDTAGQVYTPRGGLELVGRAGYVDCYRRINRRLPGFTYPAPAPACRIDFIFASPELAGRLSTAYVVVKSDDVRGDEASDHLPVFAEFGTTI